MPKDTEINPQDSGMSLPDLHNLLRDVLSKNQNRDKNFLKNELMIKPLIEVSKHSFDDACSPLAVIDFKLLQGAYQHYLENPGCLTQETPISSTWDKSKWKDQVFISHRDTAGTSEDSDLEKALCDLQMSEISNNISDPELLDICTEAFARKLSFNKSVPVTDLSPSVSFSPFQRPPITAAEPKPQYISEKEGLSESFDLTHIKEKYQTETLKLVRRKKTLYGKRRKCRKKTVSGRNVNSTDSSEMLSPPPEICVNELEILEKDSCITDELNQGGLSTQEQKIDSTVLISPTNNRANVSSLKNMVLKTKKRNTKAKSKKKETKKCGVLNQISKDISEMPVPTKSLLTSTSWQGGDENQCEVFQTSEKILSGPQDVIPTSEGQADKPSTIPEAVLQNQSPTISSQVVDPEKQTCKIGHEAPKPNSVRTEMTDKLVSQTLKTKSPKSNSSSKGDTYKKPSEMLDKLLGSNQSQKTKSPMSKSYPKEDAHPTPSEMLGKLLKGSQNLKAKSPRSKSNPKEGISRISCETVKDSLSLQTEAVKCNTYMIEKESDDLFENNDHITRNLSDSGFTESEKDGDKNSNISISPLDHSNYNVEANIFFTQGTENQSSSHPENRQKVDDNNTTAEVDNYKSLALESNSYNNMAPEVEPLKRNVNSSTTTLITDDNYDLLDYECDEFSEPEDVTPFRKSPEEPGGYSADEYKHSTEHSTSCYSEVTGGDTPGQEMCPASNIISSQLVENALCHEVFEDPTKREITVAPKVPWDPPKAKKFRKRRMSFTEDEDSSASDSEKSHKRRKDISPPQQRKENILPSSCPKLDVPEPRLRNFISVIRDIEINCDNHNILEAVNSASEYLKISNRPTCLKIFQEIFLGIRDSVRLTGVDPEDPLAELVEKLKSCVDTSSLENREEDIKLCSMVIYEFFQVPALIRYALDLCCYLQNKAVPIRNRAIDAYATNAISRNAPTNIILNFLTYVKKICGLPVHQPLLKHVLQKVVRGKECYMLPEFSQLCELLCLLDAYEMERQSLQGLVKTCIENNCWDVFSRLFIAWCDKQCFPTPFLEALQLKLDETGIWFKKFAAAIYGAGEPSESTKYFFGIFGVTLIMDSCEIGREKDRKTKIEYMVNANNVLHTLHKYNVDIFRIMESFFRTDLPDDPDPYLVLCLPYSVFFNLVKICLCLNLPKDAFQLYNNYSSYLNELPQALSAEKRSSIRVMQFKQFIRVTQSLYLKDPLESGLSAFHILMKLYKHEDILNELKTLHNINIRAIGNIFTDLMVTCMNKSLTAILYQLYQYISDCHGSPWGSCLIPKNQVLRGLLVTFAKYDKMEEARSLFALGCSKNYYQFQTPIDLPWELTVLSYWTIQEMKFVIEKYMQSLFPFLLTKKSKIKFEEWYTVKIAFKEIPRPPPKISCLIVPSVPTPLSRCCSVITSINPDLRWTVHDNCILLTPITVYNHWVKVSTKNYSELQEKTFNASQRRPLVFGMDVNSESNLNLSRTTPETPVFSPNQSSSSQQSTPSFHYQQPSNETHASQNGFLHPNAILKRNALFTSSERSSSHTPECGTSVEQEASRTNLKRSFERRGSSCESDKVDNESPYPEGPASKRQRMDSSDMSQLNNFYCRKVSPRKTPQKQYPVSSHQSPPNGLIQSQTITANHQSPPLTGWNRFDRSPSYQLLPQTARNKFDKNASPDTPPQAVWNQLNRNVSHQSPPQIGRNQFDMSKPSNFTCSRTPPTETSQRSTASGYLNTGLDHSQNTTPPLPHSGERFRSSVQPDQTRNNYVDSHTGSNFTVESHQLQQNAELDRARCKSLLTQSHGKIGSLERQITTNMENFRVTQLAQFDSSDTSPNDYLRQYKNISSRPPSLMSPPNRFAMASPYPSDESELSLNNVKRNLNVDIDSSHVKSTTPIVTGVFKSPPKQKVTRNAAISNTHNSDLLNETFDDLIVSQKNNTFKSINDKPTTSLKNHSPGESLFTVPQTKTNLKAKRKLYTIRTPCKDVKVRRPITPVVRFSCKTPLTSKFKQPIATSNTKGRQNRNFGQLTVSVENNSSGRTVAAPSNAEQAPKKPRKFKPITLENSQGAVTRCPPDVFQRISTFLKTRILLKCKSLNNVQIQQKATVLANTFVENNSVKQLDSKTMKLLCKFVENIK